jgi:hypothetical protein
LSFDAGASAAVAAYRLWEVTARDRRLEARAVFEEALAPIRGVLEDVARVLAEQPALRSWLLFWRREDRSIAPVNADGNEVPETLKTIQRVKRPRRKAVDSQELGLRQ